MSTRRIEVVIVPETSKATLANLMQLYLHDMSEFTDDPMNENGLYDLSQYYSLYWQEAERYPFFITADGGIAGFALVREFEPEKFSMAEFFVTRRFRHSGVGKNAACQLFKRFQGEWHVAEEEMNLPAQKFWCTIINEYTEGHFQQTTSDAHPKGPKQVFMSTP